MQTGGGIGLFPSFFELVNLGWSDLVGIGIGVERCGFGLRFVVIRVDWFAGKREVLSHAIPPDDLYQYIHYSSLLLCWLSLLMT